VMRLPFKPAAFDNVLSVRVLQHMQDLDGAITGIRRILARDGQFLFSYHNKRNAHRVLTYPKSRRIADPFSRESAEVSPTLISHHPERMAAILGDAGFSQPDYRGAVVVNSLAALSEKLGSREPSGLRWASFTGKHRLAPWLIGRTRAVDGADLAPGDSLDELFECPSCHGDVRRLDGSYECGVCGSSYPIVDGIVDFRL
jgi:SAM-dependent methyltransferase